MLPPLWPPGTRSWENLGFFGEREALSHALFDLGTLDPAVQAGLGDPEVFIADELAAEHGIGASENRVHRLCSQHGIFSVLARRRGRGIRPGPAVHDDLVRRDFTADAPVTCYSLPELFAEKLRALAQRCRPRDLYDVVHIYRHPDLLERSPVVTAILDQKCAHAGIPVPTLESVRAEPHRSELEEEWANMLGHQLPHLPPVAELWAVLDGVFGWLRGESVPAPLPRVELGPTSEWMPQPGMTSWRLGVPLELIASGAPTASRSRWTTGRRTGGSVLAS